jgi:hypothetical protein
VSDNTGVQLKGSLTQVTTGGGADVTITGVGVGNATPGTNNHGVSVTGGALVAAADGNIILTGTSTGGVNNDVLLNGGTIQTNGITLTGDLAVDGAGGPGTLTTIADSGCDHFDVGGLLFLTGAKVALPADFSLPEGGSQVLFNYTFNLVGKIASVQPDYGVVYQADKQVVLLNIHPTLAADHSSVSAPEFGSVSNTGTFADPLDTNPYTVTLSASVGGVGYTGTPGVWNWDLPVTEGPAGPFPVTITATDTAGASASVTFNYSVADVAPTATLQTNSGVGFGQSATAKLVNPYDPSAADTSAGFHYFFALDTDTTGSATYANTSPVSAMNFGLIAAGTHTVYARIFDRDNGSTLYSMPLVVSSGIGQHFTVTSTLDDGSVGTLRWAVDQATSPGPNIIDFDPNVFSTPQTITLGSGGSLALQADTTILGPGANLLSISGNNQVTGEFVNNASSTIEGLSIVNGIRGIFNLGTLMVQNCIISGNGGDVIGAGIFNFSSSFLTVIDCTIVGNNASGSGGGIENQGLLTVTDSTISGNSASDGGGISVEFNAAPAAITNTTISGNTAFFGDANTPALGHGGGVYCNQATVTVANSTVTDNAGSNQGGGIYTNASTLTVNNTIVAGSTGGDITIKSPGTVSGSHNLIQDGSGGFTGTISGDPMLGPLGDWGGLTNTLPLLAGSPAIDAGSDALVPAGITTDQRGSARVTGPAVDIGAFEGSIAVVNTPEHWRRCAHDQRQGRHHHQHRHVLRRRRQQ